tara:strand:- start:205 stop:609 length:405 start_codon:yes stop_codon:yes gene_type:complete
MVLVGIFLNPMNILAYRLDDLYIALTLLYSGLIMASNMIWAHELVHLLNYGMMNNTLFFGGIILTFIFSLLIRGQLMVNDQQWLRRMISHHSTALTTSYKINENTTNNEIKQLSKEIIDTQEREIKYMKQLLVF